MAAGDGGSAKAPTGVNDCSKIARRNSDDRTEGDHAARVGEGAGAAGRPPSEPDVTNGYLDLLGTSSAKDSDEPKNTGAIQALWASAIGSRLYDSTQVLARKLSTAWQHPAEWLNIPPGGTALDVGSGPGNVTASLARAAGPGGLALGVDISVPMLQRAVSAESGPQVGFLRADAQRLPLRDNTVDAVVSIAVFQLIPNPTAAIAEMARVLRPGGRLAIMVPTVGGSSRVWQMLPKFGAYLFDEDELADTLEEQGFTSVRTKTLGTIQWVRAKIG